MLNGCGKNNKFARQSLTRLVIVVLAVMFAMMQALPVSQLNAESIEVSCAHCGKPFAGKYVEYQGKLYHIDCYQDNVAARCAHCGKVLSGNYVALDGQQYHESCYLDNVAIHCSHCGETIEEAYLSDFWGNAYHKYHEDSADMCEYCGRFISNRLTAGGKTYVDGRTICGLCSPKAIDDVGRARRVLDEAAKYLSLAGIEVDPYAIELFLAERDELAGMSKRPGHDLMGFTRYLYRKAGETIIDERFKVYLLRGMPRTHMIAAGAHELMHVWQFKHANTDGNDQLCEGSSNYAAFLILGRFPDKDAEYVRRSLSESTDIIYGSGFRRVARMVASEGIEFWLRSIIESDQFPEGY